MYIWHVEHRTAPRPDPTRNDWLEYRRIRDQRDHYLQHQSNKKPPEKFYVRADHFLRLFNEDFNLKGDKAMSRRTLQFYSSPQARLLPLPVYKDRHTAYYLFPDYYERLGVVWTLRSKFAFPIPMIRTLLTEIDEDWYSLIMDWDESSEALLDIIMLDKVGFAKEDFDLYSASKGMIGDEVVSLQIRRESAEETKQALLKTLDEQHAAVRKWIDSGRGIEFFSALADARRKQFELRERQDEKVEDQF